MEHTEHIIKLSDIIRQHLTLFGFAASSWQRVPGMQLPEGTIEWSSMSLKSGAFPLSHGLVNKVYQGDMLQCPAQSKLSTVGCGCPWSLPASFWTFVSSFPGPESAVAPEHKTIQNHQNFRRPGAKFEPKCRTAKGCRKGNQLRGRGKGQKARYTALPGAADSSDMATIKPSNAEWQLKML